MTDENQALPPQGSDEKKQGENTNQNKPMTMEALLKEQDLTIDLPQAGQVRKGTIASVTPSQVLVSIGAKSEGVVSSRDLEQLTDEDREALEVGKEVHVYVISPEDSNGNVVLSLKRAQEQLSWDTVEKAQEDNEIIESKIIGFNKGGLIAGVEGLRGFVPASQVSAMRRAMSTGDTPEQRCGRCRPKRRAWSAAAGPRQRRAASSARSGRMRAQLRRAAKCRLTRSDRSSWDPLSSA